MTTSNFDPSLALVLESEGGNDDDPADHGGRTSRGITQREYDAWSRLRGLSPQDVWQAPQADVNAIYHDEYWLPGFCDLIPLGLDYVHFNNSVLEGPHRAAQLLQTALGVKADGRIGPVTRLAFKNCNVSATINTLSEEGETFYRSLQQPKFLRGWLNRVTFVRANALKMITSTP